MLNARGLILFGVLLRLAGREGQGLFCDGSLQGQSVPAARAGTAELQDIVSSSCWYVVLAVLLIINTHITHGLQGQYGTVLKDTHAVSWNSLRHVYIVRVKGE
jgi:hypothetical protein